MLKTHDYLRGFTRLAVVAGILLAAWIFVFLAVIGAVHLVVDHKLFGLLG